MKFGVYLWKESMVDAFHFYNHPEIQARIAQYCGKEGVCSQFTAEYFVGYGEALTKGAPYQEENVYLGQHGFSRILQKGLDISRSFLDRESLLAVLDVEYFNLDFPSEPFANPVETFEKLEPVYDAIVTVFYRFNIIPLVIMTGRGYHFVSSVERYSETEKKIGEIGKIEQTLAGKYATCFGGRHRPIPLSYGRAFDGMGRLMEYVAHLVMREIEGVTSLPVTCTEVAPPAGIKGREAVSLDISMYGDPIYLRDIRCPFSCYQKHKMEKHRVGEKISEDIPVMICLPRKELEPLARLLRIRQDVTEATDYAAEVDTTIPEQSKGFENLIQSYKRSRLYQFHKYFDSEEHDSYWEWQNTYDRLDTGRLPPCVCHCLETPNDHLLKPTNLQVLTKVLLGLGWHPKHIAGLVRSKYERDFGWGEMWIKYDAATRANFYVRTFAGLFYDGSIHPAQINCTLQRDRGYCRNLDCVANLEEYEKSAHSTTGSVQTYASFS